MTLRHIDAHNYDREVLQSDGPFLLELTASYCAPCKRMIPILERLAADGTIAVGTLDVQDAPSVAASLSTRGTPTLILFDGGRELRRHVGTASEAVLRRFVAGDAREH